MSLGTLALLLCIVAISSGMNRAEALRLCGRSLADILTAVCGERGGFYGPGLHHPERQPPRKQESFLMPEGSIVRRTITEDTAPGLSQRGVVDECCRRACSFSTLISYCAIPRSDEDIGELSSYASPKSKAKEEEEQEEMPMADQQQSSEEQMPSPPVIAPQPIFSATAGQRPNIGSFSRNRPFFIVLPPSSSFRREEEDQDFRY